MKGSHTVTIRGLDVRTRLQQEVDALEIVGLYRPVQRGGTVGEWSVDVGLLIDERADRRSVLAFGRLGKADIDRPPPTRSSYMRARPTRRKPRNAQTSEALRLTEKPSRFGPGYACKSPSNRTTLDSPVMTSNDVQILIDYNYWARDRRMDLIAFYRERTHSCGLSRWPFASSDSALRGRTTRVFALEP